MRVKGFDFVRAIPGRELVGWWRFFLRRARGWASPWDGGGEGEGQKDEEQEG